MRKTNKALIIFLITMVVLSLAGVIALRSNSFGEILSKSISKLVKKKTGADLSFKNIDIDIFPLGVSVNQIKFSHNKDKQDLVFHLQKLGLYVNLKDIFSRRPLINEVFLHDGVLQLLLKKNENKSEEKSHKTSNSEFISKIDLDLYRKSLKALLPFDIRKVIVKSFEVDFKSNNLDSDRLLKISSYIDKLELENRGKSLRGKLSLYDTRAGPIEKFVESLDTININFELDNQIIKLNKFELKEYTNTFTASGSMKNNFELLSGSFKAKLVGDLSDINNYIDIKKVGNLDRGSFTILSELELKPNDYSLQGNLSVENFLTDFAYGDRLDLNYKINKKGVYFQNFQLESNESRLSLTRPFEFYSFDKNLFIDGPVIVKLYKFPLNNALYYLRDSLSILDGKLSGEVKFELGKKSFSFKNLHDVKIRNLRVGKESKPILELNKGRLRPSIFKVDQGLFSMRAQIDSDKTQIKATGQVGKGKMYFEAKDSVVDLGELGPFVGLSIEGYGPLDLKVIKKKGAQMFIETKLKDFSFEGFYMQKLNAALSFDFKNSLLNFETINASNKNAQYSASGQLNYKNLDINTKAEVRFKSLNDLKDTLAPIIKTDSSRKILSNISGDFRAKANISGKVKKDQLDIDAQFIGVDSILWGEYLKKIMFSFQMNKGNIQIQDALIEKNKGKMKANAEFNTKKEKFKFDIFLKDFNLQDFDIIAQSPVAIESKLEGLLTGVYEKKNLQLKSEIKLLNTYIDNDLVGDSYINFSKNKDFYNIDSNILGNDFIFKGKLSNSSENESKVEIALNSEKLPTYLSLIKFIDKNALNLIGKISLNSLITFKGLEFNNANILLNLKKLHLKKEDMGIFYLNKSNEAQFVVEAGKIKKWFLEIKGVKSYIVSKGEGDFNENYKIKNMFKIDASILEVFNKIINTANGVIRGRLEFFNDKNGHSNKAVLTSNNLFYTTPFLPVDVKKTSFLLEYRDKKIHLSDLKAEFPSGNILINGNMDVEDIIPDLNFKIKVNQASFPLLRKSNATLSGEMNLIGNRPPYNLSGVILIDKLLIGNDINDFLPKEGEIKKVRYKYLPQGKGKAFDNYLSFNIAIKTLDPVFISNSIADIGLIANLRLLGGENNPSLSGPISLAPRENKITFKNNDFLFNKGKVFFYPQNEITNPELDIVSTSVISDYNIFIKVFGPVKDFNFELTSTPALSKEDILSLIAFGYTKDLSEELTDEERESMTKAGVGSFIFDSLKINETLKSEFGLQVNLGTQLQRDTISPLEQRNIDNARVRSATTIEVKKRLADDIDLSVLSTVGGSTGQRQSMNLNYEVSPKISVEGIYETRTAPEGEEAILEDTSLGADLKFKWTFE